jgi:predicted permease
MKTIRGLVRTPLFSVTAILSLALGIGATTAIFSMLDHVLFRKLPVANPHELVFLYHPGPLQGSISTDEPGSPSFSYPMFREMQARQTPFSGLAGAREVGASLSYRNGALMGTLHLVSGNYFQVLGVTPAIGRVFDENDDRALGGHPVLVLSHRYWVSRFGSNPAVLNQPMIVNGHAMTIVGVARNGFTSEKPGSSPDVFVPITMKREMTPEWDGIDRKDYWVTLFGRLKPGVTLERAATAINVTYREQLRQDIALLSRPSPDFLQKFEAKKIVLKPGDYGRGQLREQGRRPLFLLLSMTLLVLLIACANVANLQLTRAVARTRETAVRLALGASRGQLLRQLLLESCTIAAFGAIAGLLVAYWLLRGILVELSPDVLGKGVMSAGIDPRMLLFALGLGVGTGVLFGLYPALHASRAQLTAALRDQNAQTTAARSTGLFRKGLVTLQAAVSILLLISAGLLAKTFLNLSHIDLGLRTDHLMVFSIDPKLNGYTDQRVAALYDRILERLSAMPGVATAAAARVATVTGAASSGNMTVEGFTPRGDDDADSSLNEIAPGYFRTLGVPLVAGREFTDSDRAGSPKVAIVNEAFVKHFIGTRDPLGVRAYRGGGNVKLDTTIVGVVKDVRYSSMREPAPPVYYTPLRQSARQRAMTFYVRTLIAPEQTAGSIRALVASIDPDLPLRYIRTMGEQIDTNVSDERLLSMLTGGFAVLATLLAAIGLYGVLAFNVARRTREIGIRMALGADAAKVRRLVVREVVLIIGTGLAIGIGAAAAAGRLIESVLFNTRPLDPVIFLAAAGLLGTIALAAAYVPARRATGVDPMVALRYE